MVSALASVVYFPGYRSRAKSSCRQSTKLLPPALTHRYVFCRKFPTFLAMQLSGITTAKDMPVGLDKETLDDYSSQAKLLQEFTKTPSIDQAWIFKSDSANRSQAMFLFGQTDLLANKKRKFILSSHIAKSNDQSIDFQWSPFPVEMDDVSSIVPSPSGSKLLVIRHKENQSPMELEIWGSAHLEKSIRIPQSVHGTLYTDGWFEGISWNNEETHIAYVAEEPFQSKPVFNDSGFKVEGSADHDCGSWKGQGDWEEDWGETYSKKRRPALFIFNITSGEILAVKGIPRYLSAGQVVWAPSGSIISQKYLVFVGWSSDNGPQKTPRKLGMKYCYNRPCALYAVRAPLERESSNKGPLNANNVEDPSEAIALTDNLSSAFFPRFSPDGKYLVFLSARAAVESGVHWATNSLHRMDWPADGSPSPSAKISCVVPVVMSPEDDCFPGLYCSGFLPYPWLSNRHTIVLSSAWRSTRAIVSINILSGKVLQVSPSGTVYSWDVLALDGDDILAVSSSPIDPPQIKYGYCTRQMEQPSWSWLNVPCPLSGCFDKVRSLLSSKQCSILKIPVNNPSVTLPEGVKRPFEAIFVLHSNPKFEACKENKLDSACNPVILVLHGGPHAVSSTTYSKSLAFLSSLGYNILLVNYRGSLGFGEEALQSLPGNIGSQDVDDVLSALDYICGRGLVDGSKVAVLGGSHGGFLTTHLIAQAPRRFVAAATRNPLCNISLMVGTTDIPDWCYIEACGTEGKRFISETPSTEFLSLFYHKSPISHLSKASSIHLHQQTPFLKAPSVKKVKTPILFLLGAQDARIPVYNGLQFTMWARWAIKHAAGALLSRTLKAFTYNSEAVIPVELELPTTRVQAAVIPRLSAPFTFQPIFPVITSPQARCQGGNNGPIRALKYSKLESWTCYKQAIRKRIP
ncbi:acylaminoacyl-peptidase [Apostasia shenzhenica]|uniref:Acylamino-acid-releasing enzyme n=1 Tax=Apostasia shenzhenica TaxID=1088818 RepID=A0A2I0B0V4_9ASPA|nr:acylaminoacyl-peptidase [Apostasia shenzhenica]